MISNAVQRCQLTLALCLRGLFVDFGRIPANGSAWVKENGHWSNTRYRNFSGASALLQRRRKVLSMFSTLSPRCAMDQFLALEIAASKNRFFRTCLKSQACCSGSFPLPFARLPSPFEFSFMMLFTYFRFPRRSLDLMNARLSVARLL